VGDYKEQTIWTNYYDGESENTEQQSGPIYYTLFRQVHGVATVPFYQPPQALQFG